MSRDSKPDKLRDRLALIGQISARLGSCGRLSDHFDYLTGEVCRVLEVDACIIRELRPEGLFLVCTHGIQQGQLPLTLPSDVGIAEEMLTLRAPVVIQNAELDPITSSLYDHAKTSPGHFRFRSFAGAPMIAGDIVRIPQTTDMMSLLYRRAEEFTLPVYTLSNLTIVNRKHW